MVSNETTFYQDIKKVYTDAENNVSQIGREFADGKNQAFDNVSFGITLIYIFSFGLILVFGPSLFASIQSFSNRVAKSGLNIKAGI